MEDCLGLKNPLLFFVQLNHSVIKAALGITRLTNLYVILPPTLFLKWLFSPHIGFYLALNNVQLLSTGRHYTDLGIISDLFACVSAALSSRALSDWKPQCKHLSLLTHEYQ